MIEENCRFCKSDPGFAEAAKGRPPRKVLARSRVSHPPAIREDHPADYTGWIDVHLPKGRIKRKTHAHKAEHGAPKTALGG